jgi:hypothetical protein
VKLKAAKENKKGKKGGNGPTLTVARLHLCLTSRLRFLSFILPRRVVGTH